MTKVEHQRAPWRDPSREHESVVPSDAELIEMQKRGELPSDEELARDPPDVRPPRDSRAQFHWVRTPQYPKGFGEPIRWIEGVGWISRFPTVVRGDMAARMGWEWMAPCEPPEGSFY